MQRRPKLGEMMRMYMYNIPHTARGHRHFEVGRRLGVISSNYTAVIEEMEEPFLPTQLL